MTPSLPRVLVDYALETVTSIVPVMALYHVLYLARAWEALLAWWSPWSDASLFMATTFAVREGMYFG
jgi:hypothetical protein